MRSQVAKDTDLHSTNVITARPEAICLADALDSGISLIGSFRGIL